MNASTTSDPPPAIIPARRKSVALRFFSPRRKATGMIIQRIGDKWNIEKNTNLPRISRLIEAENRAMNIERALLVPNTELMPPPPSC